MSGTQRTYDVETLRRNYPLADLVAANGIDLKPAGPQRQKGLCPFHDDRRPSFLVYEDDQHFHCFACKNLIPYLSYSISVLFFSSYISKKLRF